MANVSRVRGFTPLRYLNGAPWNGQATPYLVASTYGTSLYVGDTVAIAGSSGAAGTFVNGVDCEGMPTVAAPANGTAAVPVGVVVGFSPLHTNLTRNYFEEADNENRIAYVVDDLNVIFECQEDGLVTPIAAASIGLNVSYVLGAGSTTTGMSGYVLDSSAVATTVTLPLKLLRRVNRPDNRLNVDGAGVDLAKFEVMFNIHHLATNTVGI